MAIFEQFPEDGHLWLVKWIDKVKLPHLSTQSAAIEVLLQKLPFNDPIQISRLSKKQIQQILRAHANDQPESFLYPCPKILMGAIPALCVGAVFKNKKQVGELPSLRTQILLPNAEDSCEAKTIFDEIPYPDGWDPKYKHRVLNPSEFSFPKVSFPQSQCLIFRTADITYIIPRTVIFQTFYGLHTSMARAFTNGPWPKTLKSLIFTGDLHSGMKTGIDSVTGNWNLVRQLNVERALAPLLALYYFDPYARACAESIYSSALQERGPSGRNPWHISAKIPFQGTKPVVLDVRGYRLHSFAKLTPEKPVDHRQSTKVLITRIVASTFPTYAPDISTAAFINSSRGDKSVEIGEPPPFSGGAQTPKPPTDKTTIESDIDSMASMQPVNIIMDTFDWINPDRKSVV